MNDGDFFKVSVMVPKWNCSSSLLEVALSAANLAFFLDAEFSDARATSDFKSAGVESLEILQKRLRASIWILDFLVASRNSSSVS